MARFECERCGTRKTARVLYGYPSNETIELIQDRDDIVSGGCVIEPDSPSRVCIVCHWPMADDWNAFDGPRSPEFDLFQRPIDQALARYDETANLAELGLSFDGYAAFGSLDQVAKVIDGVEERWRRTGKAPTHLGKLRTCLFFEQRASHHNGSPLERPYTQALVKALRKAAASAGEVSHKGCFVCDPHGPGLQITFERNEPDALTHAAFTIDGRWSTPDGYIPQAIVAAILDDCLTHAASTAARVEESKVEFHSPLRPGRAVHRHRSSHRTWLPATPTSRSHHGGGTRLAARQRDRHHGPRPATRLDRPPMTTPIRTTRPPHPRKGRLRYSAPPATSEAWVGLGAQHLGPLGRGPVHASRCGPLTCLELRFGNCSQDGGGFARGASPAACSPLRSRAPELLTMGAQTG